MFSEILSFVRRRRTGRVAALGALIIAVNFGAAAAVAPKVGELAPNFMLMKLDNNGVELKPLVEEGPVVLVVLRGWPGYQCPMCTRQVQDFAAKADQFAERKAKVVMVYPGPAEALKAHAQEFLQNKAWPADFILGLDPDYAFTNAYGLRWEAKGETAYPATFVIARGGAIRFAHVSRSHGNRLSAAQAIAELK